MYYQMYHNFVQGFCSCVPAKKYILAVFSQSQYDSVRYLYCILYPSLALESMIFPWSYRKMLSITINNCFVFLVLVSMP